MSSDASVQPTTDICSIDSHSDNEPNMSSTPMGETNADATTNANVTANTNANTDTTANTTANTDTNANATANTDTTANTNATDASTSTPQASLVIFVNASRSQTGKCQATRCMATVCSENSNFCDGHVCVVSDCTSRRTVYNEFMGTESHFCSKHRCEASFGTCNNRKFVDMRDGLECEYKFCQTCLCQSVHNGKMCPNQNTYHSPLCLDHARLNRERYYRTQQLVDQICYQFSRQ